jgi:hypothetical protein
MALDTLPGLRRKAVSNVFGGMGGRAPFSMAIEAYFDTPEAMEQALLSEQGTEAGTILIRFAGPSVVALFADTLEESYEPD